MSANGNIHLKSRTPEMHSSQDQHGIISPGQNGFIMVTDEDYQPFNATTKNYEEIEKLVRLQTEELMRSLRSLEEKNVSSEASLTSKITKLQGENTELRGALKIALTKLERYEKEKQFLFESFEKFKVSCSESDLPCKDGNDTPEPCKEGTSCTPEPSSEGNAGTPESMVSKEKSKVRKSWREAIEGEHPPATRSRRS